jgi:DNA polymerase epsilon subunit 3
MSESVTENPTSMSANAATEEHPTTATTEQLAEDTAAATAPPPAPTGSKSNNTTTTSSSSDFEPPAACIRRLLKQTLPKSTNISKDSLSALSRASGIFILYLTACANDVAREGRRTTIVAKDVIGALKELDFEEFVPAMEKFLEGHRKEEQSKKEEKERMKQRSASLDGGDKRDKGGKFVSGGKAEGEEEEEEEEDLEGKHDVEHHNEDDAAGKSEEQKIAAVNTSSGEKHSREEGINHEGELLTTAKKQKVEGEE